MNPNAIRQLQQNLGLPSTGVLDTATMNAMNTAVSRAVKTNPDVQRYAGSNGVDSILNAYMSGDWSGVISLTGKPFTKEQQEAAVRQAEKALAPAYKAQESLDRSVVEDTLRGEQEGLGEFQKTEAEDFGIAKDTLDQNAANEGVLFSGARTQKLNDLRNTFTDRERVARASSADRIRSTTRGYQYEYGNDAASSLKDLYRLPGASGFNPNVAGGQVTPNKSISSVYDPSQFKFQGTKPVAQKAAAQTRAATLLANKANKLSLSGYGAKF